MSASGDLLSASLATPFELWCETHDVHPEHPLAWWHFEAQQRQASHERAGVSANVA